MRVSLPISTAGRSPGDSCPRRTSTSPAAKPKRTMKSGVIGGSPTSPRMPSVPKYFLVIFWSSILSHRREHRKRVAGSRDVMHAQYCGALLRRQQCRGNARSQTVAGGLAGERAERGLARPAREHRHPEGSEFAQVAQQFEVMFQRLAETEARVDNHALQRDSRRADAV